MMAGVTDTRINLLPQKRARFRMGREALLAAVITLLLLAGLGLAYGRAQAELAQQRDINRELEQKVQAMQSTETLVKTNEEAKKEIEKREQALKQVEARGLIMSSILKEIEKAMPATVVINSISVSSGSLDIGGRCPDNQVLATFVAGLRQSKMFKSVNTLSSQVQSGSGGVSFSIQVVWEGGKS